MRDIRSDLRQRLDLLHKERDEMQAVLEAKLNEINLYEQHLAGLLALEEKRAGQGAAPSRPSTHPVSKPPATTDEPTVTVVSRAEFEKAILAVIDDGQEWQLSKIKAALEADGWQKAGNGSFGRSIHGTLLSLTKNFGLVESAGKGRWRKAKKVGVSAA